MIDREEQTTVEITTTDSHCKVTLDGLCLDTVMPQVIDCLTGAGFNRRSVLEYGLETFQQIYDAEFGEFNV